MAGVIAERVFCETTVVESCLGDSQLPIVRRQGWEGNCDTLDRGIGWSRTPRDVETLQTNIAAPLRRVGNSRSGSRRPGKKSRTNAWRRTRRWHGSSVSRLYEKRKLFAHSLTLTHSSPDTDATDDRHVCFCRVVEVRASLWEGKVSAQAICTTW